MTARSLFNGSHAGVISGTSRDQVTALTSSGNVNAGTDYDRIHYRAARPFTWERFYARGTNAVGTGRKTSFRKAGAAVAEALITPDSSTAAEGVDNSTRVDVAKGDVLSASLDRTNTNSSTTIAHRSVIAAPGSRAITPLMSATTSVSGSSVTSNVAVGLALGGALQSISSPGTTEFGAHVARFAGDWEGLYAYVSSCSGAASQVTAYKNNVATSMLLSIGVGESGLFFNNTSSIPFVVGDKLEIREDGPSGCTVVFHVVGSSLISENRQSELFGYGARTVTFPAGAPYVCAIGGPDPGAGVTLANIQQVEGTTGFPARLQRLRLYSGNTSDQPVTATVYVNGAPTALTLTIPTGTGLYGKFETAAGVYVDLGANDRWALVHTVPAPMTSGLYATAQRTIMVEDLTPPFKPKITWHG